MLVYRIQKEKYADDISGNGALIVSGRWHIHSRRPVLYTSSSRSLAILEMLAHLPTRKAPSLLMLTIEVPDRSIREIRPSELPDDWNQIPPSISSQTWGTDWLESDIELAIAVPSVISNELNVLLNTNHPDFKNVTIVQIEAFSVDGRLL